MTNVEIQSHEVSENRGVVEIHNDTLDPKKKGPPIYELLTMVLLDTFTSQLHMADLQTKVETENAEHQVDLINQMNKCNLKTIPQDAWGPVQVEIPSKAVWDPVTGTWTPQPSTYRTSWRLMHPEKLNPIQMANQQQMKIRQELQSGISVLKQNAQLTVSSVSTTLKESSQTSTLSKEMFDTASAVIRKISRM